MPATLTIFNPLINLLGIHLLQKLVMQLIRAVVQVEKSHLFCLSRGLSWLQVLLQHFINGAELAVVEVGLLNVLL